MCACVAVPGEWARWACLHGVAESVNAGAPSTILEDTTSKLISLRLPPAPLVVDLPPQTDLHDYRGWDSCPSESWGGYREGEPHNDPAHGQQRGFPMRGVAGGSLPCWASDGVPRLPPAHPSAATACVVTGVPGSRSQPGRVLEVGPGCPLAQHCPAHAAHGGWQH